MILAHAYAFFHTYILPQHHLAKPSSSSLYQGKTGLDGIDWKLSASAASKLKIDIK